MEIDWKFAAWLIPLIAGAMLTFGFGWLDSTLKYRREAKNADAERERGLEQKKRQDAREHAHAALTLASKVRDRVTPEPRQMGVPDDDLHEMSGARWDRDEIRELRDVGILIPNATVREVITTATNFVTASSMVADGCGWELTPREIQLRAMVKLREVLGAYLRIEEIDEDTVDWFRRLDEGLHAEWAAIDRLAKAHAGAYAEGSE